MKLTEIYKQFKPAWTNRPGPHMKTYTLADASGEQPGKVLFESQLHPSVLEENLSAEHPVPHFDKAVFSWIAPEYHQHPKSVQWWLWAAIVLFVAVIIEAATGNWSMLIASLVFGFVYWYSHEHHPPRHTKINISELGVKVGHAQIPYANISAFWIIYDPPYVKKLYLRVNDRLFPDIVLELEQQDPEAIRSYLEQYLPEITGVKEHLSDIILRIIKL